MKVTIITAEALKKKQLETIQKAVLGMVGGEGSKSVDIDVVEDASIIGGLQVLIGDQFLDLSVQSRINTLNTTLTTSL